MMKVVVLLALCGLSLGARPQRKPDTLEPVASGSKNLAEARDDDSALSGSQSQSAEVVKVDSVERTKNLTDPGDDDSALPGNQSQLAKAAPRPKVTEADILISKLKSKKSSVEKIEICRKFFAQRPWNLSADGFEKVFNCFDYDLNKVDAAEVIGETMGSRHCEALAGALKSVAWQSKKIQIVEAFSPSIENFEGIELVFKELGAGSTMVSAAKLLAKNRPKTALLSCSQLAAVVKTLSSEPWPHHRRVLKPLIEMLDPTDGNKQVVLKAMKEHKIQCGDEKYKARCEELLGM